MSVYYTARDHLRTLDITLSNALSDGPSPRARAYLMAVQAEVRIAIEGKTSYQLLDSSRSLARKTEDIGIVLRDDISGNRLQTVRNRLDTCLSFIKIIERELRDEDESDDEDNAAAVSRPRARAFTLRDGLRF